MKTINIDDDLHRRLKIHAVNSGVALNSLIVGFLQKGLGEGTHPQVPTITTGPIPKVVSPDLPGTNKLSLATEFHPVPKGGKGGTKSKRK